MIFLSQTSRPLHRWQQIP